MMGMMISGLYRLSISLSTQKSKLVLNLYNPVVVENHLQQHPPQNHHQHQQQVVSSVQGYVANRSQQTSGQANDFGHYMEYVDSPPDSKEAWPVDYLKGKFSLLFLSLVLRPSLPEIFSFLLLTTTDVNGC